MKALLFPLLGLTCLLPYLTSVAKDLEMVLADSVPGGDGVCRVPYRSFEAINLPCVRGKRADGAKIYAIRIDGEIIAVYEQLKDEKPKLIWANNWQDV